MFLLKMISSLAVVVVLHLVLSAPLASGQQLRPQGGGSQCAPEVAGNVEWGQGLMSTETSSAPCQRVFRGLGGGVVRRTCENGTWSSIDFSDCTLEDERSTSPFLLLWVPLLATPTAVTNSTNLMLADLINALDLGSLGLQASRTVNLEEVSRLSPFSNYSSALVQINLPMSFLATPPGNGSLLLAEELTSSLQALWNNASQGGGEEEGGVVLGGLEIFSPPGTRLGYQGFHSASMCSCGSSQSSDPALFRETCVGVAPVSPCHCSQGTCQCRGPEFVGDGRRCGPDVDWDSYPAVPLDICTEGDNRTFCTADNCPRLTNPGQDELACSAPLEFTGCRKEVGPRLGMEWANTPRGETDTQKCSGSRGFATRQCLPTGMWSSTVDVSMCRSYNFDSAFTTAEDIFGQRTMSLRDRLVQARDVTTDIVSLTRPGRGFSLLPSDLNSTNRVLSGVIELLEESLNSTENTTDLSNSVRKRAEGEKLKAS